MLGGLRWVGWQTVMQVLGLISGTSVDGVDAAVVDLALDGDVLRLSLVGEMTLPWPPSLRSRVLAILPPASSSAAEVCLLDHDLGVALGALAERALAELAPQGVDLVASHGQTIHHEVDTSGRVRGTLQVGQPAEIAERLGVPVVADFRVRDVAAGGQGAPLVSVLDQLILAGLAEMSVAALNLGGIANLTVVRADAPPIAFDCGPANALLDSAVGQATGEPHDVGGARTASGTVDGALLDALLADPYLAAPPPKSTGKERYHAGYLTAALARTPVARLEDLLATLAAFTASAVAADVGRYAVTRVWASGGGVRNIGLMRALERRLADVGATLGTSDELGLPVDHKEACAFALLGWLTWHGLPGSVPSCTGAAGPRVLGAIVPGRGPLGLPPPLPAMPRRVTVDGVGAEKR
ncbi:MAG: anhydro-N-acetylmuramic acid kinase [Jiangellaceae bacterium]